MESKVEFARAQTTSETDKATGVDNVLEPLHTEDQRRKILEQLYAPLQPWETRLIALQPGQFDDPLVADLQTAVITFEEGFGLVDEHRNVQYEALSYTWGGEILSHPFICNGLTTGITENLSTALRYLRLVDDVRYLWVDAICINQANNEEKSRQIRNLRVVFERAWQVVAWLGVERQNTRLAVEVLKWVGEQHEYEMSRINDMRGRRPRFTKITGSTSSEKELTVPHAVLDFMARPWFSRAWIVQEVCAAKSISIQCGRCIIDWQALSAIFAVTRSTQKSERSLAYELMTTALGLTSSTEPMGGHEISEMTALQFLLQTRRTGQYRQAKSQDDAVQDLYNLLRSAAHLQATDPRDRIWALVGLTNLSISYGSDDPGENRGGMLCIDYGKPVAQAFAELTKFFLVSFGYPKSLLLPHRYRNPLASTAPSWMLNFEETDLPSAGKHDPESVPTARDHEVAAATSSSTAWEVLTLEGWHIGTVCDPVRNPAGRCATKTTISQSSDYPPYDPRDRYSLRLFGNEKNVRNTPCLHEWLLNDADSNVKWNDASLSLIDLLGRQPASLRQTAKVEVKRLVNKNARFIPQTSIEAYVNFRAENRWVVHGSVQNGDIIVHLSLCDQAYVLRDTDSGDFKCLGTTDPVKNILVRPEISDSYERPAHGYPVPNRDWPHRSKYKRSFNIC